MPERIKAIETLYDNHNFRSRTEARWAVFFNEASIKYIYEPEGFRFDDGTSYLPDFYLPDQKIWFEAKGVLNGDDEKKISNLRINGKDVIIGYSDMTFQVYGHPKEHSWLVRDLKRKKIVFQASMRPKATKKCKYICNGNLRKVDDDRALEAIYSGLRARFDHGYTPKTIHDEYKLIRDVDGKLEIKSEVALKYKAYLKAKKEIQPYEKLLREEIKRFASNNSKNEFAVCGIWFRYKKTRGYCNIKQMQADGYGYLLDKYREERDALTVSLIPGE